MYADVQFFLVADLVNNEDDCVPRSEMDQGPMTQPSQKTQALVGSWDHSIQGIAV
jgi:hypothetical protein